MGFCAVCSKPAERKCTKCKVVFYCNRDCQLKDWRRGHRKSCKPFSIEAEQFPNDSSLEQVRMCSAMNDMLPMFAGSKMVVPVFHREYQRRYPKDKVALEQLERNYLYCKMNHMAGNLDQFLVLDKATTMKRWGFYSLDEVFAFLASSPTHGDILQRPIPPYGSVSNGMQVYDTNKNTQVRNIPHSIGKTYVAIGFVDLQQLLMANFQEAPDTDDASPADVKPLVFVGFDQSIIAVARSLILYEMMKNRCQLTSILQVWYSSGWTQTTREEFEETCRDLLTSLKTDEVDGQVLLLIKFWKTAKISFKECKAQLSVAVEDFQLEVMATLKNEIDRMDYAHFLYTGLIFGQCDEDYRFGNVTMFKLPPSLNNFIRCNGNIFQTVSQTNFAEFKGTLMNSLTQLFTDRLSTLVRLIEEGKVVCRFRVAEILPTSTALHREIQGLEPAGIDWSNILDYLQKKDALTMTLRCSSRNTVHTCHFMNWVHFVYGASIVDYTNRDTMYGSLLAECNNYYNAAKAKTAFLRPDGYYMYPLNIADKMLAIKMHRHFIDYFLQKEKLANVMEVEYDDFNLFERSHSTFHLAFKFRDGVEVM